MLCTKDSGRVIPVSISNHSAVIQAAVCTPPHFSQSSIRSHAGAWEPEKPARKSSVAVRKICRFEKKSWHPQGHKQSAVGCTKSSIYTIPASYQGGFVITTQEDIKRLLASDETGEVELKLVFANHVGGMEH